MMIRQSTRHEEHAEALCIEECTRCTETIRMQNKEEMRAAGERNHTRGNGCCGQELKYTEEA
jgi:hypothetical protein